MSIILALLFSFAVKTSWYGEEYRGKLMANGQPFDPDQMTCATWDVPFGTRLLVSSATGGQVEVVVTDRGPAKRIYHNRGVKLDLSRAAFEALAPPGWTKTEQLRRGIIWVNVKRL